MNPKYINAKCFLLVPGGYEETTYEELCRRADADPTYLSRKFIPLHGMLMEVTESDYAEFYKNERRSKYLDERAAEIRDISIEQLIGEEFEEESYFASPVDVEEEAVMSDEIYILNRSMALLNDDELKLITALFYDGQTEREYADAFGFSRSAVHKRKLKILKKLKILMKK